MSNIWRLRNAIIQQKKTDIGYTRLGSILCSGTQWINTNIIPNDSTEMLVECQSTGTKVSFIAGSRVAYANSAFCLAQNYASNQAWLFQIGADSHITESIIPDSQVTDFAELFLSQRSSTVNRLSVNKIFPSFTSDLPVYLCACNQSGSPEPRLFIGLVYRAKIWDNKRLVRDFIPVQLNDSGEIGFLDLVENTFYPNQGDGVFENGMQSKWVYPDSIFMDRAGNFTLRSAAELDPAWSYDSNTKNIILSYDSNVPPDIYVDKAGNIIVRRE